jgi:hypothetical protein
MPTTPTILKKWMLRWCGCGPSDCQKRLVEGARRAATAQPGLDEETVQLAREEISLQPGGGGGEEVVTSVVVWSGGSAVGCRWLGSRTQLRVARLPLQEAFLVQELRVLGGSV